MSEKYSDFLFLFEPYVERFLDYIPISWAENLALAHPYFVFFAVAYPLGALFFGLSKKVELNKAGASLYRIGMFFVILSFLSGESAYIDVRHDLSLDGLDLLNSHEAAAYLLIWSFIILLFLKAMFLLVKKDIFKKFINFFIYIEALIVLYLFFSGIDLVFSYGAGVVTS